MLIPAIILLIAQIKTNAKFSRRLAQFRSEFGKGGAKLVTFLLLAALPHFIQAQAYTFNVSVKTGEFKIRPLNEDAKTYVTPFDGNVGGALELKMWQLTPKEYIAVMYLDGFAINTYLMSTPKKIGTLEIYPVLVHSLAPTGLVMLQTRYLFVNPWVPGFGLVSSNAQVTFGPIPQQDESNFK